MFSTPRGHSSGVPCLSVQMIPMSTLFQVIEDIRLLGVNIDRTLIFGYHLHEHFMPLILKFGQYLQHSLFIT